MTTSTVLACEGLTSGYDGSVVIEGMSFNVDAGQVYGILGKNGMGKSTLLKTIMGYLTPMAGVVRYLDKEVTGMETHRFARLGVAYVPQEAAIFQDLTVEENLRLALASDRELTHALEHTAMYFPVLPKRRKQLAGTLSGGEQKMLLMARALISEPTLMMVDEISEGLQPTMLERITEAVNALAEQERVTVLLVEQNVRFVDKVADTAAVIKRGRVISEHSLNKSENNEELLSEMIWA